jgi:hypothetical protein
MVTNAAARHTMPPMARLLFEIPRARTAAVSPFAWGAAGCHGPDSDNFATRTANLLHRWNRERPTQPVITASPAGTPDDQLSPGTHIDRPHTRLTIAW